MENISLRCRAHNVYESELIFGPYDPPACERRLPLTALCGRYWSRDQYRLLEALAHRQLFHRRRARRENRALGRSAPGRTSSPARRAAVPRPPEHRPDQRRDLERDQKPKRNSQRTIPPRRRSPQRPAQEPPAEASEIPHISTCTQTAEGRGSGCSPRTARLIGSSAASSRPSMAANPEPWRRAGASARRRRPPATLNT